MRTKQVFTAYDHDGNGRGRQYRFCPDCATPLARAASTGARPVCPRCGFVHYQNPAPGVVILITAEDRVLLGRRAATSYAPAKWCLPGGYIEFGEDFLTAGIREVREETGLTVEIDSILSVCSNFLAAELHTLVVVLHARVAGGEPRPGDDLEELGWFPLSGPFPELAFEADRHIIERFRLTPLTGAPVDPVYATPSP
ncbi:MAG TPA: NUDIX hydrolase [Geobacteraceae bacterium]